MPFIRNPAAYAAAIKRNNRGPAKRGGGRRMKTLPVFRTKSYQQTVRGRGGYFTDKVKGAYNWVKSKVPKGTARVAGALGGALLGGRAGMAVGGLGGDLFGKLTGLGSYKIRKNSMLYEGQGPPIIANSHGNVRIRHREFIQDISSSTNFALQFSEGINPGNRYLFPWLAELADAFQQHRWHGLIFEFKSTSADALNSTNTALGTVIQMTDYNVYATPPTNKQIMENQEYSVSCKPSESCIHAVECAPSQTQAQIQYVRLGPVPAGQDARLYDLGQFNLATVGSQAVAVIGELWASYDIELMKPQLVQPQGQNNLSAHYANTAQTTVTTSTGPFRGMLPLFDNIGLTFDSAGQNIIFPAEAQGNYLIQWNYVSNNTGTWLPLSASAGTGATMLPYFNNNNTQQSIPQSGVLGCNTVGISTAVAVTFENIPANVAWANNGALPSSAARADLFVTQVNLSEV